MGWRDTSDSQKFELYNRRKQGEDITVLAKEIGMNVETLSRQLRRFAQQQREVGEKFRPTGSFQVTDNGNTKEIESKSIRITTLEQLLEACEIDLNEWIVERHVINKWEVGRKEVIKNLNWEDGILTGSEQDTGGISVEPLIQIKVWLVRRHPEPITPVIKPVNINVKFQKPAQRVRGMNAALIIPDTQFGFSRDVHRGVLTPFHDRRALDIVLQIAQEIEPDVAIHLGDLVDMSAWSDKYIRRPEFYFTTQPSLIEAAWFLAQVRNLTVGDVSVIEGNHDLRPETMIINHLLEAYQLRSADNLEATPVMGLDNLLGLSRMGVQYVTGYPEGEVWLNDTTKCVHGNRVKGAPGQTAVAVAKDANETVIFGHIHRREMATRTLVSKYGYRTATAFTPGCLCHVDGRVPGSTRMNQWQQGAAIVWYDEESSTIVPIEIYAGKAIYNGEMYVGRDYLPELREDTGWDF